jgi:MerR family transcriptional regulator, thiopeptide resistance regulator
VSKFERVIPVLVYRDLAAAHDFLVRAFGFDAGGVYRDADGRAVHGEVRAGSTVIWLHRVTAEHGLDSPASLGAAGSGLVIHVTDVDAHCARARAAGAQIQLEPADQPYGHREYEARDPEGHRWWFATPLRPPTEL